LEKEQLLYSGPLGGGQASVPHINTHKMVHLVFRYIPPLFRNSVLGRFSLALFFFCTAVTLAGSCLLLFLSFQHDQKELGATLATIHQTTEKPFSSSLYHGRNEILDYLLQGIIGIPGIDAVTIERSDGSIFTAGSLGPGPHQVHQHPIIHFENGQQANVGQISIFANSDRIIANLKNKALTLFISFSLFTLLFIGFTAWLFYLTVGENLQTVVRYAEQLTSETLDRELELGFKKSPTREDNELTRLQDALNRMRESLRQTLATLREKESYLNIIVNSSSDAIILFNREGRRIFSNDRSLERLGMTTEEAFGSTYCELAYPDQEQSTLLDNAIQQVVRQETPQQIEFHRLTPEGLLTFELLLTPHENGQGQVESVVGISRDVTNRSRAEEILHKAFRHMPLLMTISEVATGEYIEVNDRFVTITGYSREETIGTTSIELGFISPETRQQILDTLNRVGYVDNMELQLKRADGQPLHALYFAETIDTKNGRKLLSAALDLTEQNKQDAIQRELEQQLQQAIKMEAIGTLAGGIAHDFNNILAAVLGYGQMAWEKLSDTDTARKDIKQVIDAGERAAALVRQILAFSRQGQEDFKPLKIQHLLKETLKMLRSVLPTTIGIDLRINPDCGMILADATQIHQIIMNLCTNAKQAIGSNNGTIKITLDETVLTKATPCVDGSYLQPDSYLFLEVSDTGRGMDVPLQKKIFDPFFTTKSLQEGTGLGLSITLGIVQKHGGGIVLKSVPDQGSAFGIYLPLTVKDGFDQSTTKKTIAVNGTERIIVVDDDVSIAKMLKNSLSRFGYTITSFTESAECLQYVIDHKNECDLIISCSRFTRKPSKYVVSR
jgi:PAS domain S-box-containing protein